MLLEEILSRENLLMAHKRVVSNKGRPGVDGIKVEDLMGYCQEHWQSIKQQILDGKYTPQPVRKVEIPKPGGGLRLLGIPCTIDRLIMQAINQRLVPIFDPGFSENSFGFRPKRSAHEAIKSSGEHIAAGYTWVVNIDLEKFFDKVNHDILMSKLHLKIDDKRVLWLIRKYLTAGIMANGIVSPREKGTVQGGPLSPLLSNIMLDELDKELECRGHRFCRFADDFNVYVKSQRAGERVMVSVERFLLKRLKLPINQEKSEVVRSGKHCFLGFSFYGYKNPRIRIAPKSIKRFKDKIRKSWRRWRGMSIERVIQELNLIARGWVVYFRIAYGKEHIEKLEAWILRRLRCLIWRQWKTMRTRFKKLLSYDVNRSKAARAAYGRGRPWFSSKTSAMNFALKRSFFEERGWLGLTNLYLKYQIIVKFV